MKSLVVNIILAAVSMGMAAAQEDQEVQGSQSHIINDLYQRRFRHFGRDGQDELGGEEAQVVVAVVPEGEDRVDEGPIVRRQVHDYNFFNRDVRQAQQQQQGGGQQQQGGAGEQGGSEEESTPIETIIQLVMTQQMLEAQKVQVPTPSADLIGRLFDFYLGPEQEEADDEEGGGQGQRFVM